MCRCTHSSLAMHDSNMNKHSSNIPAIIRQGNSWQFCLGKASSYFLTLSNSKVLNVLSKISHVTSVIMADSLSILTVVSIHIEICLPRISFIHHYIIQSKITKFLTAHDYTYCTFIHHWLYAALVFCTLSIQHILHSYALL